MRVTLPIAAFAALFPAATAHALDASKQLSQYVEDVWGMEEGLPLHTVFSIAPASDGFIWAGTGEGLAWFDGNRFRVFDRRNTPSFPNSIVHAVVAEKSGSALAATLGGGLVRVSPEGLAERVLPSDVRALRYLQDGQGALWLAGSEGVFRANGESRSQVAADPASTLTLSANGDVWAGGTGRLLRFHEGAVVQRFGAPDGLPDDAVNDLAEAPDGTLWIGTGQGLYALRDGKILRADLGALAARNVKALLVDREGSLWIGTDAGLARAHDGRLALPAPGSTLAAAYVNDLAEDREGGLWIATSGNGLLRLRDGTFSPIGVREGLSNDVVWPIVQDSRGFVWVGTNNGLNRIASDGAIRVFGQKEGFPAGMVTGISEDRGGTMWVALADSRSLVRIREDVVTTIDLPRTESLARWSPTALAVDAAGDLWASGFDSGLVQFRDGKFVRSWTTKDGMPTNAVTAIGMLRSGAIWMATRKGLALLDEGKLEVPGPSDLGLGRPWNISTAYEDVEGTLWVGSERGLLLWSGGKWTHLSSESVGLPDEFVLSIVEDGERRMWVSTNIGIFRFDRDQVPEAVSGRRARVDVRWFGTEDGMRTRECNGPMNTGTRTADGHIWFSTPRGVAVVDPARVLRNEVPPSVRVLELRANETLLADGVMPAGTSRFEVEYTASSLRAPTRTQFKYKLEGFDPDWVEAGSRRIAYFTNVPPGEYRFRVIAANEDGVWNEAGAASDLQVAAFFWQTRAFTALCLLGSLSAGAGAYGLRVRGLRARARELEQQVEERTKSLVEATNLLAQRMDEKLARAGSIARFGEFAATVAHDLKTPLTFIRGELELLDEKRRAGDVDPAELERAISALLAHCKRMRAEIETGMSYVRPPASPVGKVDVGALLRELALLMSRSASAAQVRIDVAPDGGQLDGNAENLRHALANLVDNAIEAMPHGGTVALRSRMDGGVVEITVSDDGPGVPESVRSRLFRPFVTTKGEHGTGLGLASCRRIVEDEHHGEIRLVPTTRGATFLLRIPERRQHP